MGDKGVSEAGNCKMKTVQMTMTLFRIRCIHCICQ